MNDIISELKRQINFVDLATSHGYETNVKKSTKKCLFMERGDDKILVYQRASGNENFYYTTCNNDQDKGDIINFVINKGIVSNTKQAIPYLKELDPYSLNLSTPVIKHSKDVVPFKALPMFDLDADNYLIKKRSIPMEILKTELFNKSVYSGSRLYTDEKIKSAIFPLVNQSKVVGQNIRNVGFEHLVENSDKSNGYWSSSQNSKLPIAVFENPIDGISHQVITKQPYTYRATIGSPAGAVVKAICQESVSNNVPLVLCGDHDKSGQHFNLNFLTRYISLVHSVELSASFNANNGTYSVTLQEPTGSQENTFKLIGDSLGSNLKQLQKSDSKIAIITAYDMDAIKAISNSLMKHFSLEKNIKIETSKSKDFNQDLQNSLQIAPKKKKVQMGFSM